MSNTANLTGIHAQKDIHIGNYCNGGRIDPVTVHVLDESGELATDYDGPVTMGCEWDTGYSPQATWIVNPETMLKGTLTVQAAGGVAVFADIGFRTFGAFKLVPRLGE